MVDLMFEQQDSLGLKSLGRMALEAGVLDTLALVRCAEGNAELPMIAHGLQASERIHLRGTPTILLNGIMYGRTPTLAELQTSIDSILGKR